MKKIKITDILSCSQRILLGTFCVVISACSSGDASATSSQTGSTNTSQADALVLADNADPSSIPGREFFSALLTTNKGAMGSGHFNLNMPAIWVFSSQGRLVRIVHEQDALDAFQAEYSAIDPDAPNMTCQHVEEAVNTVIKQTWRMGCTDEQWIALLLRGPRCKTSCEKYQSVLEHVGQKHHDTLRVKTLLVDLKA